MEPMKALFRESPFTDDSLYGFSLLAEVSLPLT